MHVQLIKAAIEKMFSIYGGTMHIEFNKTNGNYVIKGYEEFIREREIKDALVKLIESYTGPCVDMPLKLFAYELCELNNCFLDQWILENIEDKEVLSFVIKYKNEYITDKIHDANLAISLQNVRDKERESNKVVYIAYTGDPYEIDLHDGGDEFSNYIICSSFNAAVKAVREYLGKDFLYDTSTYNEFYSADEKINNFSKGSNHNWCSYKGMETTYEYGIIEAMMRNYDDKKLYIDAKHQAEDLWFSD